MSLIIDNLHVETILTASTIYSGATELGQTLSSVFVSQAQYTANTVQGVEQGSNIITGNTSNYPSISVVASPSFAGLTTSAATTINSSLTVTGTSNFTGALQSGGTNLYSIFTTLGTQVTFIQPGSNIATGGTVTSPIISVVASPSFAGLTTSAATTINSSLTVTGTSNFTGALQSGGTNLYSIFTQPGAVVSNVSAGSNIVTGGTATNPTISVTASPSFNGLTLSGTGQFAGVTATSISGGTVSGGTFVSAGTSFYSVFQPLGANTVVNAAGNLSTGGTFFNETIVLAASPSFAGLTTSAATTINSSLAVTGTSNFTGAIQSGATDLNNIFTQGSGTSGTLPLFNGTRLLGNSIITQVSTGVTVNGSVNIIGNLFVVGTATTIDTQTIQTESNIITLNYSGTHASAINGGVVVLSGQPSGTASIWATDTNGNWSANTQIIATNGLNVFGGALQSGGTNLYSIFSTVNSGVQTLTPGSNITTGGTVTSPIISVVASPSFAGLTTSAATTINSSLTVTGTSNFTGALQSGGTNLNSLFQPLGANTVVTAAGNLSTGGTFFNETIILAASPSFAGLTTSGATTHNGSLTVTGTSNFTGQIQSGGTNIDTTFLHQAGWLNNKAGTVSGSTFAGNPKTAAITFTTPFTGNYAVSIMADVSRTWNVQSVTLSGFTINSNANTAFASNNVYWTAIQIGEGTK